MRRKNGKRSRGQSLLEYILLVAMIATTIAVVIRNSNRTIYLFWTGLTRQIARGCADCSTPDGPDF